jgi:hypothetical protein
MDPDKVQDFVTMAFCLEAISDKEGCTTRFSDIPGKPLESFIRSGIKSGKFFRLLASEMKDKPDIFGHLVETIIESRGSKTINFGLLEIMFPAVYARILCNDREKVVDTILSIMKKDNQRDAMNLIEARKEAWKTSVNENKRDFSGQEFREARSPYRLYMMLMKRCPEGDSNCQWAEQYERGLPLLRAFFEDFKGKQLLEQVKASFDRIRLENPDLRLGIIADMCAAAIFLHLSFE